MRIKRALVAMVILAPTAALADISTDTVRQRAEQACYDDVTKLCNDAIPDEAKITVCMERNKAKLSPVCRQIFDAGIK